MIRRHCLQHFIQNLEILVQFATIVDHDVGCDTEAYHTQEQQDQLLLSWLQSTISIPMPHKLIGCTSLWLLWDKIHNYFHAHMNAKARQLCTNLRLISLEVQSVSDFLSAIQNIVDSLIAIGDPISVEEHIDIIIEGLPENYDSSIVFITNKLDLPSIDEIETVLAHESQIEKFRKKNVASINVAAT